MKTYNKLVRDRIPEIIKADGKTPVTRVLDDKEYLKELIRKLQEECDEFKADQNVGELADLQEVILALADALGIPHAQLAEVYGEKARQRGAFKKKIFLIEVNDE